jgi:hypothetical protein
VAVLSVRVPDDVAARFDAAAAPAGRSALLRRLVDDAVSRFPGVAPELAVRRDALRVMVRLAPPEATHVTAEAAAMGLPRSSWVAALVRSHSRGGPTFSRTAELSLMGVRSEIRRIGVNVNQIARALNTAVIEGRVLEKNSPRTASRAARPPGGARRGVRRQPGLLARRAMSEFRTVRGFEEVWPPPVRPAIKRQETHPLPAGQIRVRLARIARRAPEVMVKITGRTRDPAHLAAHLSYITRNGELPAKDRDGLAIRGRSEVSELAQDWSALQMADSRRRAGTRFSVAVILSMPSGTDAIELRDAARAFARTTFSDRFDYLMALHTDARHPHVHLTIRALGDNGERLNPKKADLEAWRQGFAQGRSRNPGAGSSAADRKDRVAGRRGPGRSTCRLRGSGKRQQFDDLPVGVCGAVRPRERRAAQLLLPRSRGRC